MKCEHGYTGKVVPVIYQCVTYDSLTTCQSCSQGYYLKKPHLCVRVKAVAKCKSYNTEDTGVCTECISDHYLDTNVNPPVCKKRVDEKPNCDTHAKDSEDCVTCETNYFLKNN